MSPETTIKSFSFAPFLSIGPDLGVAPIAVTLICIPFTDEVVSPPTRSTP